MKKECRQSYDGKHHFHTAYQPNIENGTISFPGKKVIKCSYCGKLKEEKKGVKA